MAGDLAVAAGWDALRNRYWAVDDYALFIAEVEHRNWVNQLLYAVKSGQPAAREQLTGPGNCGFGEWYFGPSAFKYRNLPEYQAVMEPHRRVHELALEIDRLWRAGQAEHVHVLLGPMLEEHEKALQAIEALELAAAIEADGDQAV